MSLPALNIDYSIRAGMRSVTGWCMMNGQLGSADSKSYEVKELSDCPGLEWLRKIVKKF